MRKIKFILVTVLLMTVSYYSEAVSPFSNANKKTVNSRYHDRTGHHNGHHNGHHGGGHGKPVGAPLDGGLLTILGAAGVGYYLIRKKKKNANV